jgi:uncharacterized protein
MSIKINRLTLFDHFQLDPIILNLQAVLIAKDASDSYYVLIRLLIEKGQSLYDYMIHLMLISNNKKLLVYENKHHSISDFQKACLLNDLEILQNLFTMDLRELCHKQGDRHEILVKLESEENKSPLYKAFIAFFQSTSLNLMPMNDRQTMKDQVDVGMFIKLLQTFGVGPFVVHTGFSVREKEGTMLLEGVKSIETLSWNEIYQYEIQKEALYRNTKALVDENAFQNVLLVGASGTGKSTSVKAIVNLFAKDKLRLIQIQKGQLHLLPQVIDFIKGRSFKFIIFIDDLSFEANEDEYKFLKSFMEGSISGEMRQVAFYVTSNRRHLIKEIRTERENDIHLQDFIQEMTSLSDRFGLTLLYEGLNQNEYFDMVFSMAQSEGMSKSKEELQKEARIYALRHGKMSGRVAAQFIKQLSIDEVIY